VVRVDEKQCLTVVMMFYSLCLFMKRFSAFLTRAVLATLLITVSGSAMAAYVDVPFGAWYREPVNTFLSLGYLDTAEFGAGDGLKFRPGDRATRAEFVELIVKMSGGAVRQLPATPSFRDVPVDDVYYRFFEEAAQEGWVRGDGNCYGRFYCYVRPLSSVNRAEAAALIARVFGFVPTNDAPQFPDTVNGEWYVRDIQTAADHCILQGDGGTGRVRPADGMNRAEMVAMLDRARKNLVFGVDCGEKTAVVPRVLSAVPTSPTTVEVEFSTDLNPGSVTDTLRYTLTNATDIYTTGAVLINPNAIKLTFSKALQATRSYTLALKNMMTKAGELFEDTALFKGYVSMPQTEEGELSITSSSVLPSTDGIPKGAMGVRMLSLDFKASCKDNVTVESITLIREGQGTKSDIIGIYAALDGKRISRKRIIASSAQDTDLRLTRPLLIPACQTVTLDFLADFATTATVSARHSFLLELPDDVRSTARTVQGSFPFRGPLMRIATVETGTITVEYRPVNPNDIDVGDTSATVGKFQLSVNSVEDHTLQTLLLKQIGSASDGDLTNLRIRRSGGTPVTKAVARTVSDYALFIFDPPLILKQGDKMIFEVVADIIGGASDTLRMRFEEEGDLYATGSRYGRGSQGKMYGSQVVVRTSPAATLLSINAGKFTVETDGPSTKTYSPDTRDALLANIRLTPGTEAADIKNLYIAIQGQTNIGGGFADGSSADDIAEVLDAVRLRNIVTGRSVGGQRLTGGNDSATTSSKTYQIYRFDDFFVRGAQTWELRVNFKDNGRTNHPKAGDRFRILICGEPTMVRSGEKLISNPNGCDFAGLLSSPSTAYQMRIRGLTTNRDIADVRPRGTITGNFHSIESAKLSITVNSIGTTDIAVRGAKNVSLLRFEATAGLSKNILFTKFVFEAEAGSLLNGQNYTLWVDDNDDGAVDTILEKGVAASGNRVVFGKLAGGGYAVSNQTTMFEVRSNIASSLASDTLRLRFAQNDANYIEAEEFDDGSSLSGINTNGVCSTTHCDIAVTTTTTKLWSLLGQGNLFVTRSSIPVRSRQLLGGTLSEAVLRLRFRAQHEDIDVTNIHITSSGSKALSVDRLELFREGEMTAFAQATVGSCGSDDVLTLNPKDGTAVQTFCATLGSQQLVVPNGQNIDVIVRARMKSDQVGGISGENIQWWLTGQAVADNTTGSGAVRARGFHSSAQLVANDGNTLAEGEIFLGTNTPSNNTDIIGNRNVTLMAKIITVENANPDRDGTLVKGGTQPFGQFRFAAAGNGNSRNGTNSATLSGIMFSVSATNVVFDAALFKLYNKADASIKTACSPFTTVGAPISGTAQGAFLVECSALKSSDINTVMGSGEALTLVLEGMITNPQVVSNAGSALEASLNDFSLLAKALGGFGYADSHIHFLDEDGSGSTDFYWIEYPETSVRSTGYRM
jgi:hypothetical protein